MSKWRLFPFLWITLSPFYKLISKWFLSINVLHIPKSNMPNRLLCNTDRYVTKCSLHSRTWCSDWPNMVWIFRNGLVSGNHHKIIQSTACFFLPLTRLRNANYIVHGNTLKGSWHTVTFSSRDDGADSESTLWHRKRFSNSYNTGPVETDVLSSVSWSAARDPGTLTECLWSNGL